MLLLKHVFSETDQKTRKRWLIASAILWLLIPIFYMLISNSLFQSGIIGEDDRLGSISYAVATTIVITILAYCAYVKHGNKYLTFALVVGPLKTLHATIESLKQSSDIWSILETALGVAVYVWWYIEGLKLRIVNKKVVALKKESKEYLQSIYSLRMVKTIKTLNELFSNINKKWPNYESTTLHEYKMKKKKLTLKRG